MHALFLDCYIKISILIALTDGVLAIKSILKNKTTGRYLGFACAGAAVVDISYLISILNNDYLCVSVMSSIYFVNIDIMLICLLIFTVYFTKGKFTTLGKRAIGLSVLYAIFEAVIFTINPFCEIAVHYVRRDTYIAKYSYQMKPLYWMHLLFTYTLVAVILILLIRKLRRIPQEYRSQYRYVILGIVTIVAVNGVFLYWPGVSIYNLLDYSICGYSLTAFLLYWSCFEYSTHGMLNCLKTSIFENIGQGIVLFDYHDHLILHNKRADDLLGGIQMEQCAELKDFLNCYGLSLNSETENDSFSLQCYIKKEEEIRPLRCDIRSLKNEKEQRLGQLFVFSDAALETDLLTGFQNLESFRMFVRDQPNTFPCPTAVAICDINSLSVINSTMGNHVGDQKIRLLADTMRQYFPKHAYYVRGLEAHLIALCSHSSEAEMQDCMERVKQNFSGKIQYAVSMFTKESPDIVQTVYAASQAMRAKKLLDRESIHSEMLTSLVRALQECDSDTEHHVRRTQLMGETLGKRIELTDIQQSNLSLLCLLHDIGKIGIPLEILNKPGKLSEEEWKILRSHTQKGYDIANSNTELKGIAEDILHHHERWDGTGYPDGLSGESIPLLSRVIAVVDAYDAMVNDRSYRRAVPVAKAMEELKRCAGTQFDPYIVSEFLESLKENPPEAEENRVLSEASGDTPQDEKESTGSESAEKRHNVHLVPYSRYLLDDSMYIVSVDENFERMTGYTAEDIRQTPIRQADLIPDEDRIEYLCQTNASLAKNPLVFQEHKIRRKDGSDIYVFCCGRIYYDSAVRAERSEIIIADVTNTYSMKMLMAAEQNKAQVRLRYWERTYRRDSLTGLLNHAAFRSDVELKILEGRSKVMMLMVDVDRFKEYNDTFGHHNGDKFLILAAQTLMTSLRKEDRACRMGGDEFAAALFFDKDTPDAQLRERAQQIFDKVNITLKAVEGGTGISMGMVIAESETTFNQLYEAADKALYHAKDRGRGRLSVL
ncbi:diguanylate cyclase domain-containing protein [Pseudoflavonifractor phocaeensis]|uniref:diguanylate cyclase domain-containing protein n=1 Tax=Pseudoflavonifractor phocaeensis TaxID=1870988 RepID=UPI001F2C0CB4|nr:diguanylate cyclase [Pseudoflavonifractor phocaeensis]MCF2661575.1 diguanylate cyclase [Pseudoflavonifractor phocaeensis]